MPYRDFLYACLGGILLGVGFIVPALWWTSLLAFAPFLYAISRAGSRWRIFALGALFGFVAYGLSFYTVFWSTLPLGWLGITQTWFAVFAVFLIWFMTTAGFALAMGGFAIFVRWCGLSSWMALLGVPSAWVLADWLGMWIFSIHTLGPHSILGANFSMGSFGYLLADDAALIQGAWFGGMYALNFEVAFVGALIFLLLRARSTHERVAFGAATLALVCVWGGMHLFISSLDATKAGDKALSVAAVSTQTPDVLYPTAEQEQSRFDAEAASIANIHDADLIALPEGSGFLESLHRSPVLSARTVFARAGRGAPPVVVDSVSLRETDGKLYSRTEYYDGTTGRSTFAYKRYLMPFGEQLPYFYRFVSYALGQGDTIRRILGSRGFSFKEVAHPVSVHSIPVSTLLCSEAMSPTFYREQAERGAQVFVNISSHAWFHRTYNMYIQALHIDQVRAAENRRWLVEAGNVVPSFIIDPYGRVIAKSAWGSAGVLTGTLYARTDRTPYSMFGEWVLLVPLVIFGFFVWHRRTIAPRRTSA